LRGPGALDDPVQRYRRAIRELEQRAWPEAEDKDKHGQRSDAQELASIDLREASAEGLKVFALAPF
jgi:hypothetical protein